MPVPGRSRTDEALGAQPLDLGLGLRRPPRSRAWTLRAAPRAGRARSARRAASSIAARVDGGEAGAPRARRARPAPIRSGAEAGSRCDSRRASGWRSSSSARWAVRQHAVARPGRGQLAGQLRARVQVADPVRAAQPLLARGGVEVAAERAPRRRARRRGPGRRRAARARRWRPARRRPRRRRSATTRASRRPARVSGPTAAASSANGDHAHASPRAARAAPPSGASTPGCSSSLVSTSSPRPRSSAYSTALTPSVVEPVSASSPGSQPISAATRSRSRSIRADRALEEGRAAAPLLELPAQRLDRGVVRRARGTGPLVPAFR